MADKAPKKKNYLQIGAPGPKSPTMASGMWPDKAPQRGATSGGAATPGGARSPLLGEPNPVGRPPSNLGKYLVKPSPNTLSGFEMLNDNPDVVDQVHQKFLKAFELPTHLQPVRFRSPTLEHGRALSISRGWRRPRSLHG
jgi:hypothetical protein